LPKHSRPQAPRHVSDDCRHPSLRRSRSRPRPRPLVRVASRFKLDVVHRAAPTICPRGVGAARRSQSFMHLARGRTTVGRTTPQGACDV
jgi:hypothetical protein